MTTARDRLAAATWAYLLLPPAALLFGWCRWFIALPAALLAAWAIAESVRAGAWRGLGAPVSRAALRAWIVGPLVAAAFLLFSGWGGFVGQTADHVYRNALLSELVKNPWPVALPDGRALSYNLAWWLPPALAGRVFGETAARLAVCLWGGLGLFLAAAHLRRFSGAGWAFIAFALYFFGPLDVVQRLAMVAAGDPEYNFWNLGYVGIMELLVSQAQSQLPTMLLALLLLRGRVPLRLMALAMGVGLLFNPLGMNALGVLGIVGMAEARLRGESWRTIVSPANGAGLIVALAAFALLRINAVAVENGVQWRTFYTAWPEWLTMAAGYLVYTAFLPRADWRSPWIPAAAVTTLLLPFAAVWGGCGINDWCMKGGMALMPVVLAFLLRACRERPRRRAVVACVLFLGVWPAAVPTLLARNLFQTAVAAAEALRLPQAGELRRLLPEKDHRRFEWNGSMYHPESPLYNNFTGKPDALYRAVFRWEPSASRVRRATGEGG